MLSLIRSDGSKSGAPMRSLGKPDGLLAMTLPFSSAESLRPMIAEMVALEEASILESSSGREEETSEETEGRQFSTKERVLSGKLLRGVAVDSKQTVQ
ncbi:hypothetical protein F2Q68_00006608 [Brassica cretica]|uniref:Uncharacterized protein n=2 Tax=Brassica cretica TaxID=69181 RepID=A0A8S9J8U9_BRACR|nr:hypothetical protein F2Q68_00006608 [Brassica cretica]